MADRVVIAQNAETTAAPEGHDDKMIALADKAAAGPEAEVLVDPSPAETPEAETPAPAPAPTPGTPAATPSDAPQADQADAATEVLEDKGLNYDEFSTEFAKDGKLSDDSYAKLEKAGIPKAMVDQFIAGQVALTAQYEGTVKSAIGGDDEFKAMATWAAANLTPQEKAAYHEAIDSHDLTKATMAVQGVHAKFRAAVPAEPNLLGATTKSTEGTDIYESWAQVQEDMRNPKYKTDSAFRNKVQTKLGRSNPV